MISNDNVYQIVLRRLNSSRSVKDDGVVNPSVVHRNSESKNRRRSPDPGAIVIAGYRGIESGDVRQTWQFETGKDGSPEPIDLSLLHLDGSMNQNRKLQRIPSERRQFEGTDSGLFAR